MRKNIELSKDIENLKTVINELNRTIENKKTKQTEIKQDKINVLSNEDNDLINFINYLDDEMNIKTSNQQFTTTTIMKYLIVNNDVKTIEYILNNNYKFNFSNIKPILRKNQNCYSLFKNKGYFK